MTKSTNTLCQQIPDKRCTCPKARAKNHQLVEDNLRYEMAAKATNDAMYDYDVQKGLVIWNDVIYTHYGYPHSDDTTPIEWWAERVHPDDALRIEAELSDWLDGSNDTLQMEYRFMRGDGSYATVHDRGFLQRDSSGKPLRIIGSLLDVSEQRQLDKAKDEFISLVSHQLRTPLTIIRTYSEMFMNGYFGKLKPEQLRQAQRITNASARLIDLISDMLNLSRIEMGRVTLHPIQTDMNALIQGYINEFIPLTKEKSITTRFNPDTTLTPLCIDAAIYGQVVYNLLENAIRYSHNHSTITITFNNTQEGYLLRIQDTGIGIADDDQVHIFERFFRAANAPSTNPNGTGLGLYLVKLIMVDTFGGKVWCKSKLGAGTEMYALLPPVDFDCPQDKQT